jgi:di/tricarboxylate transporter
VNRDLGAPLPGPDEWGLSPDSLEHLLRRVPFFRDLDRVDAARLIGALEKTHIPAGTLIFEEGGEADALYLLERGDVEVTMKTAGGDQSVAVLEAPSHFGDLGLLLQRRTASVRTVTDVAVWTLPRQRFEQLARDRVEVGLAAARSLARMVEDESRKRIGARPIPAPRDTAGAGPSAVCLFPWRTVGGVLAVSVPLVLWRIGPPGGLSVQGWHVSLIVLAAAIVWVFQTAPDFVVALAMATAWGVTGLVPLPIAFAGFADPSWVLAFGAIGLAAAMARSGLLFRLTLLLLRIFPRTHAGQVMGQLVGGVVMTPLVPLAAGRIATAAVAAYELAQGLGYATQTRATAALAFAALIGASSFSSVFLTGLATNFFVIGLLPEVDRARVTWLTWLAGAAPAGAILFIGATAVLLLLFRAEGPPKITLEAVQRQSHVLGRISRREVMTVAALVVLLLGFLLQPVLRINPAWLGTAALVILLTSGVLDRASFRTSIDWGFLVLFGLLVGAGAVFRSVGLDRWISDAVVQFAGMLGNRSAVVVVLALTVVASRFVLPRVAANFLLSLAFVPAAWQLGLAPWLVGFVVLTMGNTWILPGLSDFYALTRDATGGQMFTDRDGFVVGAITTLLALVSIAASVPYWRAIGLLGR